MIRMIRIKTNFFQTILCTAPFPPRETLTFPRGTKKHEKKMPLSKNLYACSSWLRRRHRRSSAYMSANPPCATAARTTSTSSLRTRLNNIEYFPPKLRGARSRLYRRRFFASKYALESSRRDLHNALLCTVLDRSRGIVL